VTTYVLVLLSRTIKVNMGREPSTEGLSQFTLQPGGKTLSRGKMRKIIVTLFLIKRRRRPKTS
jgi:hypothetical protein